MNDQFTIGASYKSKQEFSALEYQLTAGDITNMGAPLPAGTYKLDLDFQQQVAVGIAFRPTSQWTISADLKWINWSDTMDKLSSNLILPAIVESHYTMGADFRLNNRWDLGFHYMYVPEKTMTAPATDAMAPGAAISLSETSFGANIGYRF